MTGAVLTVRKRELAESGFIHLAFSLGSKEKVVEITKRLREDDRKVISGPRTTGESFFGSALLQWGRKSD